MVKIKGAHVISAVKVLRSQRQRSRELLPTRVHKYLDGRVLPSSWYPLEDHLELARACAKILSGGISDAIYHRMGRHMARVDLTGLYKSQLRRDDAAAAMRWMTVMWKNAYDSAELVVHLDRPTQATVRLVGFPVKTREICGMLTGYMSELVLMSIDRDPSMTHVSCQSVGGLECTWTVSWGA